MNEAGRFPLDVTQLNKGDTIEIEQLKTIIKHPVDTNEWNFGILSLCQFIMKAKETEGFPVTAISDKGIIRILLDSEAALYNNRKLLSHFRRMGTSLKRQISVDTDMLTTDEKKTHLRQLTINSRTVQGAIIGRQNKLVLLPTERKTPLLGLEDIG